MLNFICMEQSKAILMNQLSRSKIFNLNTNSLNLQKLLFYSHERSFSRKNSLQCAKVND